MKNKITKRETLTILTLANVLIYWLLLLPLLTNHFSYLIPSPHATTTVEVAEEVVLITTPVVAYYYNDQVPIDVVKEEIIKQSREFGLGEQFMLTLAFRESGYNNLATNSKSTATGVYQYLWGTWKETSSWKNHHIARTDYKANIREAMIDISNGEHFRWSESLD